MLDGRAREYESCILDKDNQKKYTVKEKFREVEMQGSVGVAAIEIKLEGELIEVW